MSIELVIFNNSKQDETARIRCGLIEVEIEKGQVKTIVYHGNGEVEILEMSKPS